MSWKLAELRWRQEAGLQENFDIAQETKVKKSDIWSSRYRDSIQITKSNDFTPVAIWSQLSRQRPRNSCFDQTPSSVMVHSLTTQIIPDLDVSHASSAHVSVSSATPLLNTPRTRSTIGFSSLGWSQLDGHESKLSTLPHREELCTEISKPPAPLPPGVVFTVPISPSATIGRSNSLEPREPAHSAMSGCERDCTAPSVPSKHPAIGCSPQIRSTPGPPSNASLQASAGLDHACLSEQQTQEQQNCNASQDISDNHCTGTCKHYSTATLNSVPCQMSEHDIDVGLRPWSIYATTSMLEGLSIEARHSLDSYVLDKLAPENQRTTSISQRRPTRPLYPDLPPAHAKILGCGSKTDSLELPSEFDLRFPLACSVSSEEVDEREIVAGASLPDTSIPLQELPRREVLSAQGVLHEAEYHQESSAVFETSDIAEEPALGRRESTTLDEIVSQYADLSMPRSSPCPQSVYREALREIEGEKNNHVYGFPDGGTAQTRELGRGLMGKDSRSSGSTDLLVGRNDQDINSGSLRSSPIIPPNQYVESDDSDERWQIVPHSSRCGFLTPSKMRFRLTSRDAVEATYSDAATGRSPVSPWDPFAKSTPKRRRERLPKIDLTQRMQASRPVPGKAKDFLFPPILGLGLRRGQLFLGSSQPRPPKTQEFASLLNHSQSLNVTVSHSTQAAITTIPLSTLCSSSPLLETPNSAIPSSSLLPNLTNKTRRFPQVSQSVDEDTSKASGGEVVANIQSSLFNHQPGKPSHPGLQVLGGTARGYQKPHRDPTSGSITSTSNENGRAQKPSQTKVSTSTEGSALLRHQISHGFSLQHRWQSQYGDSDADISHFLRSSRPGVNADMMNDYRQLLELGENDLGIKAAGSSLADYSSSLTPFSRNKPFRNELTNNQLDQWKSATYGDALGQRLRSFVPPPRGTSGNSGSYGALSRVESREGTLASSNSTSASLLPRHEPRGNEPKLWLLLVNQCPSFPLTTYQLAIRSNTGRAVPFERLQMLSNGEWLERGWCTVHERNEFSHAKLTATTAQEDKGGGLGRQHQAGKLLLAFGVATYFVGGFALIHDMARQGALSQLAMGQVARGLSRHENVAATSRALVHAAEAKMAQVVERTGVVVVVLVLVACFGVCIWAAIAS